MQILRAADLFSENCSIVIEQAYPQPIDEHALEVGKAYQVLR